MAKTGGIGKRCGCRKPCWGVFGFWVEGAKQAAEDDLGALGQCNGLTRDRQAWGIWMGWMGVRALGALRGSNLSRVSDIAQKVFEVVKKQQPVGDPQVVPVLLPRAEAAAAVLIARIG